MNSKHAENKGLKKKISELEKHIKKLNSQYDSEKREWEQDKATMQHRLDNMMSNASMNVSNIQETEASTQPKTAYIQQLEKEYAFLFWFCSDNFP